MVISRAPFRISFFGGGTDYPVWFREHGGAVLATTIDKYCYLTCRYLPPFFEHRFRVAYTRIERVRDLNRIRHPSVRECIRFMGITRGLEVHHDGDLPARTGIGSSSAFTVAMLHALHALKGTVASRLRLAQEAIRIEQDILREHVGSQDQVLSAFGGLNRIEFRPNGDFHVTPVPLSEKRQEAFERHLLLVYTGISRNATLVAAELLKKISAKGRELAVMREMVDEGTRLLSGRGDLGDFGLLLHESWKLKRSLSPRISSPVIDDIYLAARKLGALGGKVLGAGGGGFVLLFAKPHLHEKIRRGLRKFLFVPFRMETGGSQIVFYKPNEYE